MRSLPVFRTRSWPAYPLLIPNMPTATAEKPEEVLAGVQQRMAGKTPAEQSDILKSFLKTQGVSEERAPEAPAVLLTDDQVKMIFQGGAEAAKRTVEAEASKLERKYHVPHGEAKAMAEDGVSTAVARDERKKQDFQQIANVFRAMAHVSTGRAMASTLHDAYSKEKEHMLRTGREVRNIDVTTGSEGGYLAPELWNTYLYENIARVNLLRKYATWFPLDNQIMRLPKITANVTATTTNELAAGTGTQPTLAQVTWNMKKLTVLTNPFSIEELEHARPELVALLMHISTVEMDRKMDEICFNTADTQWTDLLDTTVNRYYLGGSSTSGKTADTTVTFDDINGLIYTLAEQYAPDSDVSGSGLIAGTAKLWCNKSLISNLLKLKGGINNYIWGDVQAPTPGRNIFGYDVHRVLSLPSSASANTQFAVFGNLAYRWVAYRPGFIIDLLREGMVNGVNLAQTSAYALRINQLLDVQTIDDNAFARLSTSAS
jgi:HK97 family phage major capsid protein